MYVPNTEPVIDDMALLEFIERRRRGSLINVGVGAYYEGHTWGEMSELGLPRQLVAVLLMG